MKKIIVGILGLAFLLAGQSAVASGPFNGQNGDCPNMGIGNYTTHVGIADGQYGCWSTTSVSATAGQVINVGMFYHNNTSSTLTNVKASLSQSTTGPGTSFSFTGNMTSSQGTTSLGTVTLSLNSSQTVTFNSAYWYKNKNDVNNNIDSPFPNGQSPSSLMSGGINLGSVPPGWDDYGYVVAVFRVGTTTNTQVCTDTTATNYGGPLPCTYPTSNCTISNFTANGSTGSITVSSGSAVNLVWNTTGCTSVVVSGSGINNTSLSNSQTVYPLYSGSYTITAVGQNGVSQTQSIYVNMNDTQSCYINTFTANGSTNAYVSSGNSVNIVWNTTGCTSVNVSGPNLYSSSTNDSRIVYPTYSGTYTLTAYGYSGGTQTRTVYVNVNDINNNSCYINNFTGNGSTSAVIQSGNPLNLVWNTTGCTSVSVYGLGISSNLFTGSQTIYPTNNSVYTITAYGYSGGTQTRNVYVTVNGVQPPVYTNACAVTTVATNVGQNSATLNGLLTGSTGNSYFEYGRSVDLGSRTTTRVGNGSYSEVISGLSSNTIYYFRLVSECNGGLSYGKIEFFQTQGAAAVRPIIVQGTTVVGTQSPIMLKIEDRYQYIAVGDVVDYTVTYKNIGKSRLTKPVLQVVVPKGITLTNSSAGTYQVDTNTLTVPLMDLNPGDEGVVYVQGVVNLIDSSTAQIVTTAILVYTSPNGAQENAIAYVLNSPRVIVNNLGASAFWASLMNIGLIGWLLILILILLVILLTRRYYGNKVVHTTTPGGAHTTTTTHY